MSVPGCSATPHLLHFGHIPDKGFVIHIGQQFAQLIQVCDVFLSDALEGDGARLGPWPSPVLLHKGVLFQVKKAQSTADSAFFCSLPARGQGMYAHLSSLPDLELGWLMPI